MTEVGQRLRIERERRRLPRAEVARATGVYIHHLTALEHGDHGDLPEDEIVAGYVRACASHLELDAAELVADFCRERGIPEPAPPEEPPAAVIASVETEPTAIPSATREEPLSEEPATNDDEVTVQAEEAAIEEPAPSTSPSRGIPLPLLIAAGVLLVLLLVWWLSGDDAPVTEPGPKDASSNESATAAPAPDDLPPGDDAPPTAVEPEADQVPEVAENETTPPAVTRPLTVSEHGVGTGVESHRLVGESDSFAAGTKVWFWTRVRGGVAGQAIRHVWLYEGEVVEGITLRLGSSNWRTQSAKTLYSTGRWAVEARDTDGAVLARTEFSSRPGR